MGKDLNGKELGSGIMQRKDKVYVGRFVNRFNERHCVYDSDLRKLKKKFEEAKAEDKMHQNTRGKSMTLEEWHEKWLEYYKDHIRESTRNIYDGIWTKYIKKKLGKYKLTDITSIMVRELIKQIKKSGIGFETQNKVKILLVDMFDKAIIDDYAIKNPAKGIRVERDENVEPRVLNTEEQQAFFECAKGTFYYPLFLFAVTTGLRVGEIAALTKEDIDIFGKEKVVHVTKTLTYQKYEGDKKKEFHLGAPKTSTSERDVPLNKQAIMAVKMQYKLFDVVRRKYNFDRKKEGLDNFLFTSSFGTPLNPQTVIDAIDRIVTQINMSRDKIEEMESFSCHCFRHTFATRCFEAGIQPKTVQSYLGHATLDMTMNLYTHVLKVQKENEMSKLESVMDNCIGTEESNIISFVG